MRAVDCSKSANRHRSHFLGLLFVFALTGCAGTSGGAAAPGSPDAQQSLAEYDIARDLWLRRSQPRQALEHALKAYELDEGNEEAAHLIALLYLDFCRRSPQECRLDQAEKYARTAVDARSDFREATNTLGVVLIHRGKYAEAIEILKPLTQDILYQTPENAWGNLGWAYLEKGNIDKAIDALRRAIAAQPAFCVGYYRLGLAYQKKNEPAAAVNAFSQALDTEQQRCQGLQDAYAGRARSLLKLGQASDARTDLQRCVQLDKQTDTGRQCSALLAKLD